MRLFEAALFPPNGGDFFPLSRVGRVSTPSRDVWTVPADSCTDPRQGVQGRLPVFFLFHDRLFLHSLNSSYPITSFTTFHPTKNQPTTSTIPISSRVHQQKLEAPRHETVDGEGGFSPSFVLGKLQDDIPMDLLVNLEEVGRKFATHGTQNYSWSHRVRRVPFRLGHLSLRYLMNYTTY